MTHDGHAGATESGRRYGFSEPKHPEDLEKLGPSLLAASGEKAARSIGTGVWLGWRQEMEEGGAHPSARYLTAFLRGFSAPLGGWLPKGMAEYLADRLAGLHPKPKGGRLPARERERFRRRVEGKRLAREALLYGEEEAAAWAGLHETDVNKALHRYRTAALDSLEIALLNTRYPLPEQEAKLAREALAREGRSPPPTVPVASE